MACLCQVPWNRSSMLTISDGSFLISARLALHLKGLDMPSEMSGFAAHS